MGVLLDILEEHLEETEILWSRRRGALRSSRLDLAGLQALEDRLRAHLDGAALGARRSPGGLDARLRGRDADEAFAAAAALLVTRGRGARENVLEALREAPPPGRAGIVEALCHLPLDKESERALQAVVDSIRDARLAPAIEVLSFHRLLSPAAIEPALSAGDAGTRRAAARAVGRVGGPAAWLVTLGEDADAGVRDAAFAAAIRRGQPWTLERLRSLCRASRQVTPEAIAHLASLGDRGDIPTLLGLAQGAEWSEAAVAGLATLGCVECVEPLLEFVAAGRLARAAGEAFRRITGLKVPERRDEPQPPGEEDRNFEDLRPLPGVDAIRALWRSRASDFSPRLRWRLGKALAVERWKAVPHRGDLQTRSEELTRLWAREPELFRTLELDSPASRQRLAA